MKKVFVEPEVKRIELNLGENIANSQQQPQMGYYFNIAFLSCTVQDTGLYIYHISSESQLINCMMSPRAKIGGGTLVPREEVIPYLRG